MIELLIVALGFFVAWNIGANDTANCIGTAVGGGIIRFRKAIALVVVFALLGAFLEGWRNMKTVGSGILIPGAAGNPLADPSLSFLVVGILAAAGLWVLFATYLGMPISTSQSMVGAVLGSGVFLSFLRPELGVGVNYRKIGEIATSWILNPVFAILISAALMILIRNLLRRAKSLLTINRILAVLVLISSAYSAYTLGANDVGTSTGVIYVKMGWSARLTALFGALALSVGAVTFSRGVTRTIGKGIAPLDPPSAFAAQFGAALTVWAFVQMGIPVSTSQALVGGVTGVGLARRAATVNRRNLAKISAVWIATPLAVCALSFSLCWLLSLLF